MDDFLSVARQHAERLAAAEAWRRARAEQVQQQNLLDKAWATIFERFDLGAFFRLGGLLHDTGQADYIDGIADGRRKAEAEGDIHARAEVACLELLKLAADPATPANVLAEQVAQAAKLADVLGFALGNVRDRIEQRHLLGPLPDEPELAPNPEPAAVAESKGVALRDRWFLSQYEAYGTDTYHRPAAVHKLWNGMTKEQQVTICPTAPGKVAYDTVVMAIKRARIQRDGKPSKPKRTAENRRG
jgi:hypothetical protein